MLYGYDFITVSITFVYLRMFYCLYLYFQQDKRTDWSVRRIPLGGGGRCHMWPVVVLELELATETPGTCNRFHAALLILPPPPPSPPPPS